LIKLLSSLGKYYRHVVSSLEVSTLLQQSNTRIACYDYLPMTLSYLADVDLKCASTYFRYGAALFYKAQDEQDVFGSTLQAATAHEDAEAVEEESSGKRPCVKTHMHQHQQYNVLFCCQTGHDC